VKSKDNGKPFYPNPNYLHAETSFMPAGHNVAMAGGHKQHSN
jgi:hypothetical protein